MTPAEATEIMQRLGCIDTRNKGCLHITRLHWIDRRGRGEVPEMPVAEAYDVLLAEIEKPPAVKQGALFVDKGADL